MSPKTTSSLAGALQGYVKVFLRSISRKETLQERAEIIALTSPADALRRYAALLSPETLDACAEERPDVALECAAALLSPERLAYCIEALRLQLADLRERMIEAETEARAAKAALKAQSKS